MGSKHVLSHFASMGINNLGLQPEFFNGPFNPWRRFALPWAEISCPFGTLSG